MKKKLPRALAHQCERDLCEVVTLQEVSRRWHLHPNTIRLAIDRGDVVYSKNGRDYLLSVKSVTYRWGKPSA